MPSHYGVTREQLSKTLTDAQQFLPQSGSPTNVIDSQAEIDNTLNTLFPQGGSTTTGGTAGGSSSSNSTTTTTTGTGIPPLAKTGFNSDQTPEELAYRSALAEATRRAEDASNQIIDDDAIRAETLANFQGEIDSTNAVYADRISQSRLEGQGRLGSGRAIQARRGLLGSDFGGAQTDRIQGVNNEITSSIENERNLIVAQLRAGARVEGDAAIAERRAAKEAGLTEYIKSLKGASESVQTRSNELARRLIVSGETPETIGDDIINSILEEAGLSKSAFNANYNTLVEERNAENAKLVKTAKTNNDVQYQRYLIASEEGYDGKFIDFLDRNNKTSSNSGSTSYSSTTGITGETNNVVGTAPEGAGEGDYIFGKGFVNPGGEIVEYKKDGQYTITASSKRKLVDSNIKGREGADLFLSLSTPIQQDVVAYLREHDKADYVSRDIIMSTIGKLKEIEEAEKSEKGGGDAEEEDKPTTINDLIVKPPEE